MSKQKNDVFSEIVVGIFMLAVLALLVYFTICISGVDVLKGDTRVPVAIVFDEVGGLKAHDNVFYRGTKVGGIEDVEVTPSNLVVHAEVDRAVVLRTGYEISVRNLSMLGGNYLALEEGEGEILPLATTVFRGERPTDWMRDLAKVAANLREVTGSGELKAAITNFQAISASLRAMTDRIERGEGTLGRLLSTDDSIYRDLKATMANANEVSERLRNSKLVEDLEGGAVAFRKATEGFDLSGMKQGAEELLAKLNNVAARLERGEGTLGKLMSDQELYNDLQATVRDVRQVLDNYRDTTPIATFGSLVTGGL